MKDFYQKNKVQSLTAVFLVLVSLFTAGAAEPEDLSQEKRILSLYEQVDQIAYETAKLVENEQYDQSIRQWEHLENKADTLLTEAKKVEDPDCGTLIASVCTYAEEVKESAALGTALAQNMTLEGEEDFLKLKDQLNEQERTRSDVESLLAVDYRNTAKNVNYTYEACALYVPDELPSKIVDLKKAEEERIAKEKAEKEAAEQARIKAEKEAAEQAELRQNRNKPESQHKKRLRSRPELPLNKRRRLRQRRQVRDPAVISLIPVREKFTFQAAVT